MKKYKKWWFVSNNGSIEDGLNDAGIETFSANSIASMVREVIQNSLDQQVDETKPVRVEFQRYDIAAENIPGMDELSDILNKCIIAAGKDKEAHDFLKQAREQITGKVHVLRISDFNTTGLIGADTGKRGTPWHNLVKARGMSNKEITSGGSFGIGKSAPFTCSLCHTVFYASKVDDVHSYIGVSRLMSFEEKDADGKTYMTVGTGFYSDSKKQLAICEPFGLGGFKRNENGTDIYIIAFEDGKDTCNIIKQSVISNFFVSIELGKLIVQVDDLLIDKDELAQDITELNDKNFEPIKEYYDLLIHNDEEDDYRMITLDPQVYGEKYGFQMGDSLLLLKQGEDLNHKILMTRKSGMTLFEQGYISTSISFTGILLISGENMNSVFKAMEMPAHDRWEPDRCKVRKTFYKNAYKDLKAYLRNQVEMCFGKADGDTEVAYGMEEYFSDVSPSADDVNLVNRVPKTSIKKRPHSQRRKKEITAKDMGDDGSSTEVKISGKKQPTEQGSNSPVKEKKYKFRAVRKHLRAVNIMAGQYILSMQAPVTKGNVKLDFIGMAEHGKYPIPLQDIIRSGINKELEIEGNSVYIGAVKKGEDLIFEFTIPVHGPIMMEVQYYEAR